MAHFDGRRRYAFVINSVWEHLPLAGIEQIYEADTSNVGTFTWERSKLTREERIRLAKARREAAVNGSISDKSGFQLDPELPTSSKIERWGPGGDVVQELKNVIWKVGERRRKMTECQLRSVVSTASWSLPSSPQCTVMYIHQCINIQCSSSKSHPFIMSAKYDEPHDVHNLHSIRFTYSIVHPVPMTYCQMYSSCRNMMSIYSYMPQNETRGDCKLSVCR